MVEESRHWTNYDQVSEFINIAINLQVVNSTFLKHLYLEKGLTASQIATEYGLSKAAVLGRLSQMKIRNCPGKGRSDDNFRFPHHVPFGKRLVDGKLVEDKKEMKTARLIVDLRDRKGIPWDDIVTRLNKDGLKTKRGLLWKRGIVRMVHANWAEKCLYPPARSNCCPCEDLYLKAIIAKLAIKPADGRREAK